MLNAIAAFREKSREKVRPHDLSARDERFIVRTLPLLGLLYDEYFRCETEFHGELPDGPCLVVGNHNAMTGIPDMFCHMVAFWRRYSPKRLGYGLMHDAPFSFPYAGAWLNAAGAVAASPKNAKSAIDAGAAVLVFPGGDIDSCKPFSRRYQIEFGRRRGFIRTAIREGVPIVPIVSAGAHQSLFIATDGRSIAEALGLPARFRSNVWPIGFALPYGLVFGVPAPHLPPPVKIHTRVLSPIRFHVPPQSEADPDVVETCFEQVRRVMQSTLDDLRSEGRHGLFPRG
ncbi:MAG: 1-acyl-sn-glycerol-3-phosphate acyltransferase [Polyangiaceae bacterium]|nr:1-acyl-sn-glycerol-3-phosphate acyltransferase [Polyangiaceae bacterium]